jgi:hypothetical protein
MKDQIFIISVRIGNSNEKKRHEKLTQMDTKAE